MLAPEPTATATGDDDAAVDDTARCSTVMAPRTESVRKKAASSTVSGRGSSGTSLAADIGALSLDTTATSAAAELIAEAVAAMGSCERTAAACSATADVRSAQIKHRCTTSVMTTRRVQNSEHNSDLQRSTARLLRVTSHMMIVFPPVCQ